MKLLPIEPKLEDNIQFQEDANCAAILPMTIDYFNQIGYQKPWIGYFAEKDGALVGSCAFKGKPNTEGIIEVAYNTFEAYRSQDNGTQMCKALVDLAKAQEEKVIITARTLPEHNHSTRILEKNGFEWSGAIEDEEDGTVWEWRYNQ